METSIPWTVIPVPWNHKSFPWWLQLLAVYCSFCLCSNKVEINGPYHPLYMKTGSTLELTCNTTRQELEWAWSTLGTHWNEQVIIPAVENHFRTTLVQEEPSGLVSSTLYKDNLRFSDRGSYICRTPAKDRSFSVWVTTLLILKRNITGTYDQPLELECNITGFAANIPAMEYNWYKDDYILSDKEKYTAKGRQANSKLVVNKPGASDSGWYTCEFGLPSSKGLLYFNESLHVSEFPPTSSQTYLTPSMVFIILLASLTKWLV